MLAPYFARRPGNSASESKQINDPVAGVIDVQPHELYVLDSPLVQRLRYVRQLGVGQALFPTSAYSRFEHSLGAMHAATLMFDSIVAARSNAAAIYSDADFRWRRGIVRLAALLHDVGHCAFSHVSEKFYKQYAPLVEAQKFFKRAYRTSSISASETVTLLLLQTRAFYALLDRAKVERYLGRDVADVALMVRACVAGSKTAIHPDAFMAEIVNGPVDCDKLDYLTRDAHFAGVPIALDTRRLLSKLRLATVERQSDAVHALTVVQSGTRALDELAVTRVFLYDKFYYHPKLMAAEEVIRSALRSLAKSVPALESPFSLLSLGDDELLHLKVSDFAARYGSALESEPEVVKAVELLGRIRSRDLPKRAFAFAERYMEQRVPLIARFESPLDAEDAATDASVDMQLFSRELEDSAALESFASLIQAAANEIGANVEIFVGHQNARRAGSATHLDVMMPNGRVERAPSLKFKSHEWTEAYALNRATSYVYAYGDLAKVHLAAERVLANERHLGGFAPSSWMAAKLSPDDIDQERLRLPQSWADVRVRSDYLRSEAGIESLRRLNAKFSSVLHARFPSDIASEIIEAWVSQFPTGDLRDSALALLEHIRYVEDHEVGDAAQALTVSQPRLKSALWIPFSKSHVFGKSPDAMAVTYKGLSIAKGRLGELTAEELLNAQHVVFFDDALFTGTQSATMIRSWFGVRDPSRDAPGDVDRTLDQAKQSALRSVEVSFVFFAAHSLGKAQLSQVATESGLGAGAVSVFSTIDSSEARFTLKGLKCASPAAKERLVTYMRERGKLLLAPRIESKGWPQNRPEEFALGFGGLQSTLAFSHSISTATPAVLWEVAPEEWLPLLPRDPDAVRNALRPRAPDGDLPEFRSAMDFD